MSVDIRKEPNKFVEELINLNTSAQKQLIVQLLKDYPLIVHEILDKSFNIREDYAQQLLKILDANGADMNVKNSKGLSPLEELAFAGNVAMSKFLFSETSADPLVLSSTGKTILDRALNWGHKGLAALYTDKIEKISRHPTEKEKLQLNKIYKRN